MIFLANGRFFGGSKNPSGISPGGERISRGSLYNLSLDIFTGDECSLCVSQFLITCKYRDLTY